MEDEDLLQSLNQVEAMLITANDDDDVENTNAESSLGSDDDMEDSEFLNDYKSTFSFIDSELDALRSSMDDNKTPVGKNKKKDPADDSSYSSSSDRSPFQMPAIDETSFNRMRLESSEVDSEAEDMDTKSKEMETDEEYKMEQETEMKPEMESTEDNETRVESYSEEDSVPTTAQCPAELEPIQQPQSLEEDSSSVPLETKPQEEAEPPVKHEARQVKHEARRPQVPSEEQLKSKPSHSIRFFTTLVSILLAFLTGQRFPKQDLCHSSALELPDMNDLLLPSPVDFQQALDWNNNNSNNLEDVRFAQETVASLSFGEKSAHAAAIHEALEGHVDPSSEDYYHPKLKKEEISLYKGAEFHFEDAAGIFGEISPEDQSINLYFGIAEYDGFFISMEMMQYIEPQCLL